MSFTDERVLAVAALVGWTLTVQENPAKAEWLYRLTSTLANRAYAYVVTGIEVEDGTALVKLEAWVAAVTGYRQTAIDDDGAWLTRRIELE